MQKIKDNLFNFQTSFLESIIMDKCILVDAGQAKKPAPIEHLTPSAGFLVLGIQCQVSKVPGTFANEKHVME